LTYREAADRLAVSVATVYRMAHEGRFGERVSHTFKFGRQPRRIPLAEIEKHTGPISPRQLTEAQGHAPRKRRGSGHG
jgi:excisionase family DNA binding protein